MTFRELRPASLRSVGLAVGGIVVAAALLGAAAFPLPLFLWPLALTAFQLAVTPLLRETGLYRYHSALLKATVRTRTTYEVHGGTALDYFFHFRWTDRGGRASRKALTAFLEGFIDIARRVETGEIDGNVEVTGTSYFFSERTARRLGFRVEHPGLRLRLVLILYYADLVMLYSFIRGRVAFPNVLDARRAVILGRDLAARRADLERLARSLLRRDAGSLRGRPVPEPRGPYSPLVFRRA
ncbi:MAG: hypothetical protein ACHQPI_04605 [Thermoanaerobaculia bacterium]